MKTKISYLKGAVAAAFLSTGTAAYADCGDVSLT